MIGAIVTGKFKSPGALDKAVKAEKFLVHAFGKLGGDMFKGCKAYHLFTHPDGTFAEVSTWESREDIDRIMNNKLVKKVIDMMSGFLEGPYKMEIFDDALEYDDLMKTKA